MTTQKTILLAFGGLGLLILLGVVFVNASAAPTTKKQQWEYGLYHMHVGRGSEMRLNSFKWATATEKVTAESNAELWHKMGLHRDPTEVDISNVLNFLGDRGWELIVQSQRSETEWTQTTYIFKRPIGSSLLSANGHVLDPRRYPRDHDGLPT